MLHQPRSYWLQVFHMVEVWLTWMNVLPVRTTGIFNCMPWLHQLRWYYLQVFQMVGGMCQQQRLPITYHLVTYHLHAVGSRYCPRTDLWHSTHVTSAA